MKRVILVGTIVAVACLGVWPTGASATGRHRSDADVVIEWNEILQRTIPGTASIMSPRFYAMLHIAMFDAANSVEPQYRAYRIRVRNVYGASAEAAAAQAARDVLTALIPTSQSVYDAALAARLATISPGKAARGVEVGHKVAAAILADRQDDGWSAPEPGFSLPPFPGAYQITPGSTTVAFTRVPGVRPFAVLSLTQYLPPPPPTLTSERYTTDFNEVKTIGSVTSATRTPDQTLVARVWAGAPTFTRTTLWAVWSNVARDATEARGLSLVKAARVFALTWISIHDALMTTHTSKFVYGLWRPVTAVQRADEDLNPLTSPDPGWLPLITTPPYPSYGGNMACVGASAATALARLFGTNDMPVTIEWRTPDDSAAVATRNYPGFWQAAQEQERARVWGGIHYSFDGQASQQVCPKVSNFAVSNHLKPRH